jgi:hypothetical protein
VYVAESPLTDLERAVLELFFGLPESRGFVLAGGAALVATGLTERPTKDVDLFAVTSRLVSLLPPTRSKRLAMTVVGWRTACRTARPSGASSSMAWTTNCSSTSQSTPHRSER